MNRYYDGPYPYEQQATHGIRTRADVLAMKLLVDVVYHCVIVVDSHRPKLSAVDSRE